MLHKLLASGCGLAVGALVLLGWPPKISLFVHLMTTVVTAFAWLEDGLLVSLRAWVIALVLPVAGPICLLLAQCRPGDGKGLIESYRAYIAYQPHSPYVALADRDEGLRREMAVQPLVDDLYRGDLGERQAAAEALARGGQLPAIRLLQAALTDGDGETRLCASLALVKAEAAFADRLTRLRQRCHSKATSAADWLDLAQTLGDYAESGLPPGEMALLAWQESAQAVIKALARRLSPDERLLCERLRARAQLRTGEPAAAAATLDSLLATNPLDQAALLAACEAWYALGDFDRVSDLAGRLDDAEGADPASRAIADYWSAHGR